MAKTIAVNTRLLLPGRLDGIGWFSYHTLSRLTKDHPDYHFLFIFDRPWDPQFIFNDNVTPVSVGPMARHPLLFWYWFEKVIPKLLSSTIPDLFLSPDGFLPLNSPVPTLPVIHDINFHHFPQHLPWLVGHYYNYFFPRMAKSATRIATVSDYSKKDISRTYGISPDKIDVVYNGAADLYQPLSEEMRKAVREKITGGAPYFLIVGTVHPRKNIENQLRAFADFSHSDAEGHRLIIAGGEYYRASKVKALARELKIEDKVIFTGRLTSVELAELYGAAVALLFVSWFEGFGIPIVEAFRSHLPVITSDVSSLPEVAGDAAIYARPDSPDSIAQAMKLLAYDVEKRGEVVKNAMLRKDTFTWEKTSGALWESIQKTMHAS